MNPLAIRPRVTSCTLPTRMQFDLTDEVASILKTAITRTQTAKAQPLMPKISKPPRKSRPRVSAQTSSRKISKLSNFAQHTDLSQIFPPKTHTSSTTTEETESGFRFLDLPGEVRNQIYHLVIQELPSCDPTETLNLYNFCIPMPKLALACKQVFREVLSVRIARHDLKFCWVGHESGGALDFSVLQTPMLSRVTRRWAERCISLGTSVRITHFNFCASFSHGTNPSCKRLRWDMDVTKGIVNVKSAMKIPERSECMEVWRKNMEEGMTEILRQHGTKTLGIPELAAFRLLLQRFSLLGHFKGRRTSPQALRCTDPDVVKLKAEYLGCHLETHPWEFYQQTMT